ncbi:MAG: hypothetical protein L0Z46_10880 [Nitrospiraceae bacterium]|nr:hypothetical protein [Nitrospiraceae bacterium]
MAPPITYLKPEFSDLEACAVIAEKLHRNTGGECSLDAFSQIIGNKETSSWFGLKLNAMKAYGLVEESGGNLILTKLGENISAPIDEEERYGARITALKRFPIFAPIVDRYKGKGEPEIAFVQNALVTETKVKHIKADAWAQCFLKAAHFAGLFKTPSPPLIPPGNPPPPPPPPNDDVPRGWLTYPVPVAGGLAKIIVPQNLPRAAWEKLKKLLDALEPEKQEDVIS